MADDIITALTVLIPAVFGALGLVLVARVNRNPTPKELEDTAAARMEALVDRLQAELDRRDQQAERRDEHVAEQDAELRRLRTEVDVLHRLVSACYRILWENNLEPPEHPPSVNPHGPR